MVAAAVFLMFFSTGTISAAEKIHIAVAANYMAAFQEIAQSFRAKTGITVDATFASSGQLYAQIVNGAPYDLFLSADEERPALLYRDGRAEKPFVYARGQVVLWTVQRKLCGLRSWQDVVTQPALKKMAVANPKTAPYGAAAMDAMKKKGILKDVEGRLVFAQNIGQAFQYAATGSVDAAFCALSSTLSDEGRNGCSFSVEEAPPIVQSACLLKKTTRQKAASAFMLFLSSDRAIDINKKFGYR
jgi:molybdate transport system substrate-binding protein